MNGDVAAAITEELVSSIHYVDAMDVYDHSHSS